MWSPDRRGASGETDRLMPPAAGTPTAPRFCSSLSQGVPRPMRFRRLSRILAATLAASVLASGVALADSISVDGSAAGDIASPPSGVWAPADCSLPFTVDGLITVSYDNAGGQGHYAADERLSISAVVTHGQT